jgi:hypothetical protein
LDAVIGIGNRRIANGKEGRSQVKKSCWREKKEDCWSGKNGFRRDD